MNTNSHDPFAQEALSGSAEETLRLIASLPAPEGLENRLEAALRSAPRRGRVFAWPALFQPNRPWPRVAAAAAIALIVVGGGWGVYSRVERQQAAKVIVTPAPGLAAGGFSNSGAIRTPQTLNGPVLAQPVDASVAGKKPVIARGGQRKRTARKKPRPAPAAKTTNGTAAPEPAKN
jgi:hypothetical protein